jgi:hypothetical protein
MARAIGSTVATPIKSLQMGRILGRINKITIEALLLEAQADPVRDV